MEYSKSVVISPVSRIVRFFIGFFIALLAYVLPISMFEFAMHHVITLVLWLTAAVGWDPITAIVIGLKKKYEHYTVMAGKFKL
ncbi:MAG: DUF2892 domain-containing protein [Gammaproteobacteria bacterium]|nr:DUF2892 domain-containing protein [Gammaproteobacteria bacterium]MDH5731293.1 DUF2892 domain-containing protein [Gammaproteobacteria bacterium]